MDSEKILKIATKIVELNKILDMLNGGDNVRVNFDTGGVPSGIVLFANPDNTSTCTLSKVIGGALLNLRKDLERDLMSAIRQV